MCDIDELKDRVAALTTQNAELINQLRNAMDGKLDDVKDFMSKLSIQDQPWLASGLQSLTGGALGALGAADAASSASESIADGKEQASKAADDAAATADKTAEEGKKKAAEAAEQVEDGAEDIKNDAINSAASLAKNWGW
ncbi:uncharacterized protein LOC110244118 [Exaiptasia diaphana]|uniref:Uncharacterized protein n=1 Tax=Exaiptasia diaphana TaxID=2652724 RepID=A0A913XKX3_EXADI|nr:uncharacterized protein LOC110244118 [Exaiptasia diaphana]KXJ20243.1 hypothetical protein AC249_AIPGENE16574 [Exaiptasia diaphana]